MSSFLPIKLTTAGRFSYYAHHLRIKIDSFHQHIKKVCASNDSRLLKRLKSEKFWENLGSLAINNDDFQACHALWKKIKLFSHLNTRQLLSLLADQICPLEQLYRQALQHLQEEKLKREKNEFWPMNWFAAGIEKDISALQENQKYINALKAEIYEGLLLRSHAHLALNAPRNVDDIVAVMCEKINALNILEEPLTIEGPLLATLDDDKRLAIYDYLESTVYDKDELKSSVLSPIPKRRNSFLKSKNEINLNLKKMQKFRDTMLKRLRTENVQRNMFEVLASKLIPASVRKIGNEFRLAMISMLQNLGLYSLLYHLWHLRFLFYLGLSYLCYHYIMLILSPVGSLFISAASMSMISSVLFYTLALAPLWWLGWECLKSMKDNIKTYLLHWKKSEICDALYALTKSEECIANHLSQKIVDLPHFDIENLSELANQHQKLLNESLKKLERYYVGERFLCQGATQRIIIDVRNRIKLQQKYIEKQLQELACHIALRIEQEIDLLERSTTKLKFEPILPSEQVQKLRLFIWTQGDESALHQFKQNVNPINKWINKIDSFSIPQDSELLSLNQPWGGRSIRKDVLNGWNILLEAFTLDLKQKEATLQLNDVLLGKLQPTPQQFHEMIDKIGVQNATVLQNIQEYLFVTLSTKSLKNARLLSLPHKTLISKWYHQNEEAIKHAKRSILDIFNAFKNDHDASQYDDEHLNKIFELLEGAEIYDFSHEEVKKPSKVYQVIRKCFENYDGESSQVIRFIRFIPSVGTNKLIIEVAKKRLTWILAHLREGPTNASALKGADIELFQDSTLLNSEFNFTDFICQAIKTRPWSPKIEKFLTECKNNGLESGKLLENYQEKNKRVKSFIHSIEKNSNLTHEQISSYPLEDARRKFHRASH